jgi:hypothetical protein
LNNGAASDAYLYFDSAFHLAKNGTGDRITILDAGNVGVGTTSPTRKLTVYSAANPRISVDSDADGNPGFELYEGNVRKWLLFNNTDDSFRIRDGGSSDFFTITSTGNVGIGVAGSAQTLHVASAGSREGYPSSVLFSDTTDTTEGIFLGYSSTGNYGIIAASRLGTAWHNIVLAPSGGNIGIGTTTPYRKFSVTDAVATAQVAISYDTTRYTQFLTDSAGNLTIDPQNGGVFMLDENLWLCAGGACPSGSPSGNGNAIVENGVGIGSSTPWAGLAVVAGKAIVVGENTLATSTSMTIDWRNGNQQLVRLGTSATTISFTGFIEGQKLVLTVCNPNATAGAISWGTQVLWSGGTAPTQTTTANKCDVWSFLATVATSTIKIFGTQSANF